MRFKINGLEVGRKKIRLQGAKNLGKKKFGDQEDSREIRAHAP